MTTDHPPPAAPPRLKRSDVSTFFILSNIETYGAHAWERMVDRFPPKLVLAAIYRDIHRGLLDYGVVASRPFLTDEGRDFLHPDRAVPWYRRVMAPSKISPSGGPPFIPILASG